GVGSGRSPSRPWARGQPLWVPEQGAGPGGRDGGVGRQHREERRARVEGGRAGSIEPPHQGDRARCGRLTGRAAVPEGQGQEEVRRIFWLALGLGAGATTAVMASRWTRQQAQKVAP